MIVKRKKNSMVDDRSEKEAWGAQQGTVEPSDEHKPQKLHSASAVRSSNWLFCLSSHRDRIGARDTKSLCRGATAQAAESQPGEAETRRLAANKLPTELAAIDKLFVFMSSTHSNENMGV